MQILGLGSSVQLEDGRVGVVSAILPVRDKIGDLVVPLVRLNIGDSGSVVVHGSVFHNVTQGE